MQGWLFERDIYTEKILLAADARARAAPCSSAFEAAMPAMQNVQVSVGAKLDDIACGTYESLLRACCAWGAQRHSGGLRQRWLRASGKVPVLEGVRHLGPVLPM